MRMPDALAARRATTACLPSSDSVYSLRDSLHQDATKRLRPTLTTPARKKGRSPLRTGAALFRGIRCQVVSGRLALRRRQTAFAHVRARLRVAEFPQLAELPVFSVGYAPGEWE